CGRRTRVAQAEADSRNRRDEPQKYGKRWHPQFYGNLEIVVVRVLAVRRIALQQWGIRIYEPTRCPDVVADANTENRMPGDRFVGDVRHLEPIPKGGSRADVRTARYHEET